MSPQKDTSAVISTSDSEAERAGQVRLLPDEEAHKNGSAEVTELPGSAPQVVAVRSPPALVAAKAARELVDTRILNATPAEASEWVKLVCQLQEVYAKDAEAEDARRALEAERQRQALLAEAEIRAQDETRRARIRAEEDAALRQSARQVQRYHQKRRSQRNATIRFAISSVCALGCIAVGIRLAFVPEVAFVGKMLIGGGLGQLLILRGKRVKMPGMEVER